MPGLLVVMPARNAAETVSAAIRSTLVAMPKDARLVVWDDGSEDDTAAVAASVRDPRLVVRQSSSNLGSGGARRAAIAQEDSRFVANMDADDLCLPWRFALQARQLSTHGGVFGRGIKFGRRYIPRLDTGVDLDRIGARISLAIYNPFIHSTMFIRRKHLEGVGAYRDLTYAQDYDLWLRLAAQGVDLQRRSVPVICYRQSSSQVSRSADYQSRVIANKQLRRAYLDYLDCIGRDLGATADVIDPSVDSAQLDTWIQAMLPSASPHFRRFYEKRIKPKGTCWLDPAWWA